MTRIENKELQSIKGSGCYKYLRRFHRHTRKDNGDKAAENFAKYIDCMF